MMHDEYICTQFFRFPYQQGRFKFILKKNVSCKIINTHKTNDGRKLIVNIEFYQNYYNCKYIYAPNDVNNRCDFLKKT